MNYNVACKYLELSPNIEFVENDIKRQYRLNALRYHPDKNISIDTSDKFRKIQESYEYLMKYEGYMDVDIDLLDELNSPEYKFRNIFLSFIRDVMADELSDNLMIFYAIIQKLSSLCENKAIEYLENLDKSLLVKIYNILHKYREAFHYTNNFICKIEEIIKNKNNISECIILNPTFDDIYNETLYKLVHNNVTYAIPLWHNELVYDNYGNDLYVKCIPQLPENVEIDANNDIYITKHYKFHEIWKMDKIMINCGNQYFIVDINILHIKDIQRISFIKQGILRINSDSIYDTSIRSDVYVDIVLSL